ncbi:O-antigen ligase family protein [Microcoleus sp. bin38.metabat.b11b12b14.051]|uniref:O-antigen ligase family protein n=1 Tax=Microcoleus sp. bin38.metabat.b11b12b14.051 TaxID=2742709 RepID=UPI0026006D8B|nr:O-antigen ligase family protein [Microcoleus sp. bin38.metabat.b11b12b14.051]
MKTLYTILYALSIILINPWGTTRGLIWTSPKVLIIWLIISLNIALLLSQKTSIAIPQNWKNSLILWTIFLSIGAISTLHSPFPLTSFLGQDQMGDGWLYWLLIAAFTLSNSLLLIARPQLINSQFQGLLIGGIILAISIFPQIMDWRIDYTATMGKLIRGDVLASSIFQGQQPIGLYSHRGHAAIVLALTAITAIVGWFWRFTNTTLTAITLILTVPALLLTSTRSAIVALIVACAYLLGRPYYKIITAIALLGALAVGIMTLNRPLNWEKPSIEQVMSSRSPMWELAARGIKKRPLFGWGFDGLGIAYPYIRNPQVTPRVVNLNEFTYDYINIKGEISTREIPTYKAHNWILDTTVSVGILGLIAAIALWGYYFSLALQSSIRGIAAIAIAYLVFAVTWFDGAQYAHIAWWTLSFATVRYPYSQDNEKRRLISNQVQVYIFLSLFIISLIGSFYVGNFNNINNFIVKAKSSLFPGQLLGCGSSSGGPTDNPIDSRYGKKSYPWTSEIKWSCVYNIQDFQGGTLIDKFNFVRDIAAANGGGVIYFPAGTYDFADSIYLKSGVVIRGETPLANDAKQSLYNPRTKFVFPKYKPQLSGKGTLNSTAFKRIFTENPNTDSNIGVVNLDINRSPIYLLSNLDYSQNSNIVVYGLRSNNVAEPSPSVPNLNFQAAWQRYANPYVANIKINALANVLIANNRLNDSITDNYQQPEYQVKSGESGAIAQYDVRFDYSNHFGILVNRSKAGKSEESFVPAAEPKAEPGLFRKGIAIRDNWVYHTMRAGIRASGNGLVVKNNAIRDDARKRWWTDETGARVAGKETSFNSRAIEWAGWNVLIQDNDFQVYRHRLKNSKFLSNDGGGIVIHACCGGTSVQQANIVGNSGNSYIGIVEVPRIRDVRIFGNKLLSNVKGDWPLIYVKADTEQKNYGMQNVIVENNTIKGSMLAVASQGGRGNAIRSNSGFNVGSIKFSCHVAVSENQGFGSLPCWRRRNIDGG